MNISMRLVDLAAKVAIRAPKTLKILVKIILLNLKMHIFVYFLAKSVVNTQYSKLNAV